ncbi:MAG: hypothetical protein ACE5EX_08715, partial [Phycisphaerae bacterium]
MLLVTISLAWTGDRAVGQRPRQESVKPRARQQHDAQRFDRPAQAAEATAAWRRDGSIPGASPSAPADDKTKTLATDQRVSTGRHVAAQRRLSSAQKRILPRPDTASTTRLFSPAVETIPTPGAATTTPPSDNTTGGGVASAQIAGAVCTQPATNCQATDPIAVVASTRGLFVAADDFTLTAPGSVSSLCWWGTYLREDPVLGLVGCTPTEPDNFVVRYYFDGGGFPGALIPSAVYVQSTGSLTVSGPTLTGGTVVREAEYVVTAAHDPLSIPAGQRTWVEITNANPPTSDCTWFWEIASQGNGLSAQDGETRFP